MPFCHVCVKKVELCDIFWAYKQAILFCQYSECFLYKECQVTRCGLQFRQFQKVEHLIFTFIVPCIIIIVSKNNQHDDTCGLIFIFRGSRHSFSACFELSGSSSSGVHFSCTVSLPTGTERVGEREGYSKRLHTIPEADCTGKMNS